jgi:hypothetical protein
VTDLAVQVLERHEDLGDEELGGALREARVLVGQDHLQHVACHWLQTDEKSRIADPKLLILDPDLDPTWRVILDPDPARRSFWFQILVCEIFTFKVGMYTLRSFFCAEIELFVLKIVFLSLHLSFKRPDPQ